MHADIAAQLVSSGVDVLLGDGLGYFDGTRRDDSQDLLAGLPRSYTIVQSAEEWPISITRFTWRFTFVNGIRKR
jgi:hypothetical protein